MSLTLVKLTEQQEAALFKCSNALYFRKTYYALLLENLNKYYDPNLSTACVSISPKSKGINLVLSDWFFTLNTLEQTFVLEHELMHVSFDHFYEGYTKYPNANLLQIAADLSLNSWLEDDISKSLEPNHSFNGIKFLFPSTFDLVNKESLPYYYNILSKEKEERDSGGKGNEKLDPLFPKDGSGDSNEGIGDFESFEGDEGEKEVQKILTDSIKKKTFSKLSEHERGKYPELQQLMEQLFVVEESKVNWKREIRLFVGRNEKKDYRRTYTRLNKRFESAKGKKTLYKSKIGFIVDQSGSMDDESITKGFNEIYHLYKQGVVVHIIEADTTVSNHYTFKGKPIKTRSANGGTYMSPAIEFANGLTDLNGVVVFTDGYIESNPVVSKIPLIWIVTEDGSTSFNSPHKILKIN